MDINKQPGILIDSIRLNELNFDIKKVSSEPKTKFAYKFETENGIHKNGKLGFCILKVFIKEENEDDPFLNCSMICNVSIDSENENMSIEEFINQSCVPILISYIREIITNTTLKAGMNPIIIPPINVIHMLKENESKME